MSPKIKYLASDLSTKEMAKYLEDGLRLDMEELVGLDIDLIREIEWVYKKKSVTAFYKWMIRNL